MANGKKGGWTRAEIDWGIALAGRHPRGIDTSDAWDDWEDEDDGDWAAELITELNGLSAPHGASLDEIKEFEALKQTAIDAASVTPISASVMDTAEDRAQDLRDLAVALEDEAQLRIAKAASLNEAWDALAARYDAARSEKEPLLTETRRILEASRDLEAPADADMQEMLALEKVRSDEMPKEETLPRLLDAPERIPAEPAVLDLATDRVAAFERIVVALETMDTKETEARRGWALLQQELGRIEAIMAERVRTQAALFLRADAVTEPGLLPSHRDALADDRAGVEALRGGPTTRAGIEELKTAVTRLEDEAARIRDEVAAYGGADKLTELAAAANVPLADFPGFEGRLGGPKIAAELASGFGTDGVGALCKTLPGGAATLGDLAEAFGGGAALVQIAKDLGGADGLNKLLAGGTLDPKGAKALVDNLGAGFVGAAMKADGNPVTAVAIQRELAKAGTNLKTLGETTGTDKKPAAMFALFETGCGGKPERFAAMADGLAKDDAAAKMLGSLVTDGGMGDNPKAVAALYAQGCKGDPAKLTALLGGMGPADPARMKSLLEDGGLKEAPVAFGHLVGLGCEGDGGKLGSLLEAMDSDAARSGLEGLLTDAGLKGGPEVRTDCLAALLDPGCGGKAADFAALCKDAKPEELGKLLKAGGLGREPKILGPLVGTGCKGDVTKLNALTEKLAETDDRLGKVKTLLTGGGFGAKLSGKDTGTKPNCLAVLFDTGCEGKPAELAGLLDALDGTASANIAKMMVDGQLGQKPDVLGNLYKHGCLASPDGASDGAKQPETLKAVAKAFSTGNGPTRFKGLMTDGGFGKPGKEKRLGSVVRYAFTPKGGGTPNADEVRELANAFNNDLPALDTMLSALEGAPDHILDTDPDRAAQPGGGLRNVVFGAGPGNGHDGKASKLKTRFYDRLKNRATAGSGVPGMLSATQLIQNAASLEGKTPTKSDAETIASPGGVNTRCRSKHFAERHTRSFNSLEVKSRNTLWPRTVSEADIVTKVGVAVDTLTADTSRPSRGKRPPPPNPPVDKRDPPQDSFDLNDPPPDRFTRFEDVDGAGTDKFRVSYDLIGGVVKMTQFFPQDGDDLVTILRDDFDAIRKAIHAE